MKTLINIFCSLIPFPSVRRPLRSVLKQKLLKKKTKKIKNEHYSRRVKTIIKQIDKVDVVSFDIFDTLLFRPYVRPIDLFLHMEHHYGISQFMESRMNAECVARQKHSEQIDVTLDQIYEEIDENFKQYKQKEMDWERMVLCPNLEMKKYWEYAKQNNKKIVVASDMYLPTNFIADILKKNGFGDYDKLYVSGDVNQSKANGGLFDVIIHDMDVAPNKILHIGDNEHSDYVHPKDHGLHAYLYPHLVNTFLRNNIRISRFYRGQSNNIGASILVSIAAIRDLQSQIGDDTVKNYWKNLGYEYGGPVIYGYARWIECEAQAQNINHLMFVARDGYSLQRVFNTFNQNINNSYVYAPRFLNLICRLDYCKYDINQSSAIVNYFKNTNKELAKLAAKNKLETWYDYHDFIQHNKSVFIKLADKERKDYKSYLLKNLDKSDEIGVVDTITARFSSQKLIQNIIGKIAPAFYWSVLDHAYEGVYKHSMFIKNNQEHKYVFTKNWNFMEFLMTAPEYPIKKLGANGKPVYDAKPTDAEKFRCKIYPYVSDGAVDFANDIKKLFGGANIYLDGTTLVRWVNCLCDNPTKSDHKNMANIKHAYDSAHSDYQPLFSVRIPFKYTVLHPKWAIRVVKSAKWKTPLQTLMICISSPVKLHMRGIKQLRILICPHLKYRYLNFVIRFTRTIFYQICIGKPREIKS